MAASITTYTGIHMIPADPKPDDFCIQDIAHALSLLCRGNGHVKTFYSVGQHCIACAEEAKARGLSMRIVLACLLHDAGECYLSDVPKPLKETMPVYQETEESLLSVLFVRFLGSDLTAEEAGAVKEIDHAMLWYDLTELLNEELPSPAPELLVKPDHTVRPFAEVEEEYLRFFEECILQLRREEAVQ